MVEHVSANALYHAPRIFHEIESAVQVSPRDEWETLTRLGHGPSLGVIPVFRTSALSGFLPFGYRCAASISRMRSRP
jgi:hypothetical protein